VATEDLISIEHTIMKFQEIVGIVIIVVLSTLLLRIEGERRVPYVWERPGCHLVGYKTTVKVDGCHEEEINMNACRGFCTSYSIISPQEILDASGGTHVFTSRGSCCTIDETHKIYVTLQCENGKQYRDYFRSAKSCTCGLCERVND